MTDRSRPALRAALSLGVTALLAVASGVFAITNAKLESNDAPEPATGEMLHAPWLEITVFPDYPGLALVLLPIGVFWVLAGLIALRQQLQFRQKAGATP